MHGGKAENRNAGLGGRRAGCLALAPGLLPRKAMALAVLAAAFLLLLPSPVRGQVVSVIQVRVENGATGDPIPLARVVDEESGLAVETDVGGSAVLRGLSPGRRALRLLAIGYESETVEVVAENGRTVHLLVRLDPMPIPIAGIRVSAQRGVVPPGGIEIIPSELGAAALDLPSAMAQVPGITVVPRGGPGSPVGIQLRGATSDQLLVLLDGVPLNSPLTGEVDLNTIDMASIRRIVVLPGAQSSRYGPRAMGGVILLESGPAEESSMDVSVGAGAWGGRELSGGMTWALGPAWTVSGKGQWSRADGRFVYDVPDFRGGGVARRENADFRRTGGQVHLSRSGGGMTAHLRAHVSDLERGSPGAAAQPSMSGRQAHRIGGASLSGGVGGEEAGASLHGNLLWQRATYRDATPPFGPAYDEVARVAQQDVAAEGWRQFGFLVLRGGAQLRRQRIRSASLASTSTDIRETGFWSRGEVEGALGHGIQGELQAGVRLDRHDLVASYTLSPGVVGALERGGTRLEVSFANGFSPPGLSDLFFQEGVLVSANPDLRPERVKGELSLSLQQRISVARLTLESSVSAYRADVDDMILWLPDFRFVWSPDNVAVARKGLEMETTLLFPVLGRTHRVRGHATWSRVGYRGPVLSGQVVYRPRFSADVQGHLDAGFGEITVHVSHVGSRRSVAGSGLNELSPYTLLDLGLDVPFPRRLLAGHVRVLLSNLFDERAALLVDYPLPGRGWTVRVDITTPGNP